jgi:thioredoxin reductase
VEFRNDSVILEVNGKTQEIPNDYVWIFAGGEPPTAFLKKIGVRCGDQDLTSTGSKEVKQSTHTSQEVLAVR